VVYGRVEWCGLCGVDWCRQEVPGGRVESCPLIHSCAVRTCFAGLPAMSDSEPDFVSRFHLVQPSPSRVACGAESQVVPIQPACAAQMALVSAGEVGAMQRGRKRAVGSSPAIRASKAREAKARIATTRLKRKVHDANLRLAGTLTTSCVLRCRVRVKVDRRRCDLRVCVPGSSDGKHLRLEDGSRMDMSFAAGSLASVAKQFSCDPTTVARTRAAFAGVCQEVQSVKLLSSIGRFAESAAHDAGLLACFANIRFDETQETVSLKFSDFLSTTQSVSSWHVLVVRRGLSICSIRDDASKQLSWEVIVPLAALRSTDASCLHIGLWGSSSAKAANSIEEAAMNATKLNCLAIGCDGASSNDKTVHHKMNEMRKADKSVLLAFCLCMNHQLHLGEKMLFSLSGQTPILSTMYSLGRLLRMNGYFIRLIAHVEQVSWATRWSIGWDGGL
jgi:hypothetical protein